MDNSRQCYAHILINIVECKWNIKYTLDSSTRKHNYVSTTQVRQQTYKLQLELYSKPMLWTYLDTLINIVECGQNVIIVTH